VPFELVHHANWNAMTPINPSLEVSQSGPAINAQV
jgi:hypothetical protein